MIAVLQEAINRGLNMPLYQIPALVIMDYAVITAVYQTTGANLTRDLTCFV